MHASADALKLITFDADGTLYADGAHFDQDNAMIAHIINLMRCNVHVSEEPLPPAHPAPPPQAHVPHHGCLDRHRCDVTCRWAL